MIVLAALAATAGADLCNGQTVATDDDALKLAACTEFDGVLTLTGTLTATGMAALTFMTANDLTITGLTSLASLSGLRVTATTGTVHIHDNPALVGLQGLEFLETVGGSLILRSNAALVDSIALTTALVSVGGNLEVADNPFLCTIKIGTPDLVVEGSTALQLSCLPLTVTMCVLAGVTVSTLLTCAVVQYRQRRTKAYDPIN